MKTIRIFISGKVTGDPEYRSKFLKAEQQAYQLIARIYMKDNQPLRLAILNPAEFVPEHCGWHRAMILCLWKLLFCHHVCLLPDYKDSRGARIEYRFARLLRKDIRRIGMASEYNQ